MTSGVANRLDKSGLYLPVIANAWPSSSLDRSAQPGRDTSDDRLRAGRDGGASDRLGWGREARDIERLANRAALALTYSHCGSPFPVFEIEAGMFALISRAAADVIAISPSKTTMR